MSDPAATSIVSIELQQQDYAFRIDFGGTVPALLADEPALLGHGPVARAIAGRCRGSPSATAALRAAQVQAAPDPLRTRVQAHVGRNAEGRLRVLRIEGRPALPASLPPPRWSTWTACSAASRPTAPSRKGIAQGLPVETWSGTPPARAS